MAKLFVFCFNDYIFNFNLILFEIIFPISRTKAVRNVFSLGKVYSDESRVII